MTELRPGGNVAAASGPLRPHPECAADVLSQRVLKAQCRREGGRKERGERKGEGEEKERARRRRGEEKKEKMGEKGQRERKREGKGKEERKGREREEKTQLVLRGSHLSPCAGTQVPQVSISPGMKLLFPSLQVPAPWLCVG